MCPICRRRDAEIGVLCEDCRDELAVPLQISPEQVQTRGDAITRAALIDVWGRPHRLDPRTRIGRHLESDGLAVLEPSVSRDHAELWLGERDTWWARDVGSANGTWLDDQAVSAPIALTDHARVRFGQIAFYFIVDASGLYAPRATYAATAMIPRMPKGTEPPVLGASGEFEDERTNPGLPRVSLRLHEPTGGGGGLVELDGKRVQLTTTQFELISVMVRRMALEADQPELVRGFVRSQELINGLSWDTREPSENHVKQLVRRVRRVLMKSALGDLIESRHRFGYRLRAIPQARD